MAEGADLPEALVKRISEGKSFKGGGNDIFAGLEDDLEDIEGKEGKKGKKGGLTRYQ